MLDIIGNIVSPVLSGLFLFIFSLYFLLIEDSQSSSKKYFTVFLISFCFFLFGRPIQVLAGAHPIPLIINNLRSFLFSTITIPMVMLADFSRPEQEQKNRSWLLHTGGAVLGLIYCIFNILGTTGSSTILTMGSLNVQDSVTAQMTAPYYGREVTIAVYMILALLLIFDSVSKMRRVGHYRGNKKISMKKVYLYNTGKLIFGLSFFLGSYLQQWWIYYMGSLLSVSFLGTGITLDIKESKRRMQKVVSYIREDLIQDFSLDIHMHQQVSEMLELLNIPSDINTFIIFKEQSGGMKDLSSGELSDDSSIKEISVLLDKVVGQNNFILMSIGTDMLGLCLSVTPGNSRTEMISITEMVKTSIGFLKDVNIGIGRSYSGLTDLKNSYHEAINAVEYASSIKGGQVIHISDIQDEESRNEYPKKEKDAFLAAIRIADKLRAEKQLRLYIDGLQHYGDESENLLRVRVYELLGSMIESAISGGGKLDALLGLSKTLFEEITIIRSQAQMEEWLVSRSSEIIDIVGRSHSNRTSTLVRKAKEYMDLHYAEAISVKDVADAVCISESYFKSVFKKSSGYSYSEYLKNVRIEQAKKLLITTENTITEIAFDVGYQTANSFSALFKKQTAMTPTQYKNSRKNSSESHK
jgi:two-component system, response regulator YesN